MSRPRRTQRRTDGHQKNVRDRTYRPHGGVPWPTLGDGTMYRPEMDVSLVRVDGEMEFTWTGRLLWVTWLEDGQWVPPGGKKDRDVEKGRWKATVDWGHAGRSPGAVWLDELTAA